MRLLRVLMIIGRIVVGVGSHDYLFVYCNYSEETKRRPDSIDLLHWRLLVAGRGLKEDTVLGATRGSVAIVSVRKVPMVGRALFEVPSPLHSNRLIT